MSKTKIFMLGVTGYIGGAVLTRFLDRPDAATFDITALVRSPEKAKKLEALGITSVVGSLSDFEILEKLASESDVVIALANSDDLPATQAILRGLKKKYEKFGKAPIFINTSGAGVITVDSRGMADTSEYYDDMNADQIEALPLTQIHRPVDAEIANAGREGYVKSYVVMPGLIYGQSTGRLVDAGISNRHCMPLVFFIKALLARGQNGMIGKGLNVWPNVEIHEVADLYVVLYDAIARGEAAHGREGYYFGANGEHNFYDLFKTIGQSLVDAGQLPNAEPTTMTDEEIVKYLGGMYVIGSNCRCVSNRSYSIGWKPKKTTKDFFASMKPEVEALLAGQK